MAPRTNIFQKILIMIFLLLAPIMALYYYSTQKSIDVIESELETASLNKMELFMVQLESGIEKYESFPAALLLDTNVLEYVNSFSLSDYSMIKTKSLIKEKLSLAGISGDGRSDVSIYFAEKNEIITSQTNYPSDITALQQRTALSLSWEYRNTSHIGPVFTRHFLDPGADPSNPQTANLIMEVRLYQWGFENMLDDYKQGKSGDPFFYKKGSPIIHNRNYQQTNAEYAVSELDRMQLQGSGHFVATIAGNDYMVSYFKSQMLGWYLVDYSPLDQVIHPIVQQRMWFGAISFLIVVAGVIAAFVLYRHVQIPIRHLIRGVHRIKNGDFSFRIKRKTDNEFSFLMLHFNEMAAQIQNLIENVYEERIHTRDATLKQLQAQIHPHFLYNCLGFIINMTKLSKEEAVISMAHNLGDYYRYTTRMEKQMVSLREELDFVANYLEIHRLRMETLTYSIELPEELASVAVPRLLIQPLVENVLVHGLENADYPGEVHIKVAISLAMITLTVEDNGCGMTAEQILNLHSDLLLPMDDYTGCGLWNVRQRLVHHFGESAQISLFPSELGGLKLSLAWHALHT